MAKLSNLFSTNETFRRDLLIGLGVWLGLEIVAFGIVPGLGLIQPGERLQKWLYLSILFGLIGALLLALSPQYVAHDRLRRNKLVGWSWIFVWRILAWLGLAGLAFPLLMLSYELFAALFDQLIEG